MSIFNRRYTKFKRPPVCVRDVLLERDKMMRHKTTRICVIWRDTSSYIQKKREEEEEEEKKAKREGSVRAYSSYFPPTIGTVLFSSFSFRNS